MTVLIYIDMAAKRGPNFGFLLESCLKLPIKAIFNTVIAV